MGMALRSVAFSAILAAAVAWAAPALAGKNCVCKANGRDFHEGDVTCIMGYLARCEMFLNNTTWKKIADNCPETLLEQPETLIERLRQWHGSLPKQSC